jgi:DNA sulfur modification protein DndD
MELDTDYALNVLDRYGNAVLPELSAGERQVLSLSFILAMARVAKREAPLVMDTPLGRLSSAHREHIAQYVPGLSEQVVLFVTDQELLGSTRDLISPFIGNEYQLDFDRTLGVTTVKAVDNHG